MNHLNFPLLNPFKFVPHTTAPGVHFDDRWSMEHLRDHELRTYYKQKWQKSDTTRLQIESSIVPEALKVYRPDGTVAKTIAWTAVHQAVNYAVYELDFTLSDLAEGVYFLYQKVTLGAITWEVITEPIHMKEEWPGTLWFSYRHSFNDYDVAFTTGITFGFRVEADIPPRDMEPKQERTTSVSQTRNVKTLSGTPYRTYKLHVGEAPRLGTKGVAPWVGDLLNRIFVCDSIEINGHAYTNNTDTEWERTPIKGYPLVCLTIELVDKINAGSLQFSSTTPVAQRGFITAYSIETNFFGAGSLIPVTDVEEP